MKLLSASCITYC